MILGVDLSTKAIDLVALDEDTPSQFEHLRIVLPGWGWWASANNMVTLLHEHLAYKWMNDRNIYLAGIERPYGQHRQAIASLHTILGGLLSSLPVRITAYEISPADMRRELGLPGNCKKDVMHQAVLYRVSPAIPWPFTSACRSSFFV